MLLPIIVNLLNTISYYSMGTLVSNASDDNLFKMSDAVLTGPRMMAAQAAMVYRVKPDIVP